MSSWNSTTLEVPGAASFASSRRSSVSPSPPHYRSLPTFDAESSCSELDSDEKRSNASTSSEDLHYELLEYNKLKQQIARARYARLGLYALIATISLTTFIVLSPTIRRLTAFNTERRKLEALKDSAPQRIPDECKDTNFNEPGWVFHPTTRNGTDATTLPAYIPAHRRLRMTESQKTISLACADQWVSRGEVCETIKQGVVRLEEAQIDAAWTFVEPTNHWQAWKEWYAKEKEEDGDKGLRAKNFRSYNQIQYSIRSVFENLRFLRKGSLLAASMPSSLPGSSEQSSCRVMQAPTWLDTRLSTHSDSKLQLVPHYDIWRSSSTSEDAESWRLTSLPNFNSRAIESQLSNFPSTAETVLYLNDDFYIGQELAASDIASSLYGPVYRLSADQWLKGVLGKSAERFDGENRERNAHLTIGLINDRFSARERNWLKHVAYTLSAPMMDEVASIWAEEMKQTAESRFRSRGVEASLPLLSTLYNIEKHREALLWSFFVARSDSNGDGRYSYEERLGMRDILHSTREGNKLYFRMPTRSSSSKNIKSPSLNLQEAGLEAPKQTDYRWTSTNGYPYIGNMHTLFPKLQGQKISINIAKCFGSNEFFILSDNEVLGSEELFKLMAFEHPSCGDSIIAALVTASGEQGLEAFLPPVGSTLFKARHFQSRRASSEEVPFIGGYAKNWVEADYSLKTALGRNWKPRDFAVRLIQRYSYVLGESSFTFDRITGDVVQTGRVLNSIEQKRPAFIALNDRFADDATSETSAKIESELEAFHEKMWPKKTAYEL